MTNWLSSGKMKRKRGLFLGFGNNAASQNALAMYLNFNSYYYSDSYMFQVAMPEKVVILIIILHCPLYCKWLD